MSLQMRAAALLGRGGFALQRHPAARRQRLLDRHGVGLVIDVGAARGGYGTQLRSFGYRGDLLSFEPLAPAYADLRDRAARDGRWEVRNLALGAKPGSATIHVASNSDSSSLLAPLAAHTDAAPQVTFDDSEEVTVSTLDDELDELVELDGGPGGLAGRRPFLKLDTQGFEREVLAGGERVVDAVVGLQLELSFVPLYEGGMLADEAIAWAYSRGFHLTGFEQGFAAPDGALLQADAVFFRGPGAERR